MIRRYYKIAMNILSLRLFGAEIIFLKGIEDMDTRIALIGIIVDSTDSIEKLNTILHEYGQYIIGRMGIPYREKNVSIISVVMDATNDVISSLSGKLGMIEGISVKTVYSKAGK